MFASPQMFNLLPFLALLVLVLYFLAKERRQRLHRFLEKKLMAEVAASSSRKRRIWKDVLLGFTVLFAIFALARPRWGFEWQDVHRRGIDIFIAIDTSRSMLTGDVKPSRLERTKMAVRDLVKRLNGDRVGLIAFAGTGFTVCPLTSDYSGFLVSLDGIDVNTVPRGGTNLEAPIEEALKGYGAVPSRYRALILLTDGEGWEGDPVSRARAAAAKGVRIYTVGIGTREGDLIRVPNDKGDEDFLKDSAGNVVKSRLNEALLKEIAAAAGGVYVRSSGAEFGLDYLYDNQLTHLEKRDIESRVEQKFYERFQIPLGVALCLLLADTFLVLRRREP